MLFDRLQLSYFYLEWSSVHFHSSTIPCCRVESLSEVWIWIWRYCKGLSFNLSHLHLMQKLLLLQTLIWKVHPDINMHFQGAVLYEYHVKKHPNILRSAAKTMVISMYKSLLFEWAGNTDEYVPYLENSGP